jgi:ATP-dependent DNA ligase
MLILLAAAAGAGAPAPNRIAPEFVVAPALALPRSSFRDPESETWQTVCKVGSGMDDATLKGCVCV